MTPAPTIACANGDLGNLDFLFQASQLTGNQELLQKVWMSGQTRFLPA